MKNTVKMLVLVLGIVMQFSTTSAKADSQFQASAHRWSPVNRLDACELATGDAAAQEVCAEGLKVCNEIVDPCDGPYVGKCNAQHTGCTWSAWETVHWDCCSPSE